MGRGKLVFLSASANPGKLTEMRAALSGVAEVLPRPDSMGEVAETGETLTANARIKAKAVLAAARLLDAPTLPVLADDTGLEVDVLDGAPGVRSARYAGEDCDDQANVSKLLADLDGTPPHLRTARFRSVVLALWPDGREVRAEGVAEGRIGGRPRGSEGFGYDPVFLPTPCERSFAEMTLEEKDAVSHRGRALRELVRLLEVAKGGGGNR